MKSLLLHLLACAVFFSSCAKQFEEAVMVEDDLVKMTFCLDEGGQTKSMVGALVPDHHKLTNMDVIIFDSKGNLVYEKYFERVTSRTFEVELNKNTRYTMYVAGNIGKLRLFQAESSIRNYLHHINTAQDIAKDGVFPLACCMSFYPKTERYIDIFLEKLVAEVNLIIDYPSNFNIDIESVSLISTPMDVSLFGTDYVSTRRIPGDESTYLECMEVLEGKTVRLYIPEDLVSKNEVPLDTVVSASQSRPRYIPHLQIAGTLTESIGLETTTIVYTVPLDFKLKRNKRYSVTLTLSEQGIFEDSYRVRLINPVFKLNKNYMRMPVQTEQNLICALADYSRVIYSSSNTDVARVAQNGLVSSVAVGKATITASCPSIGVETQCVVDVFEPSAETVRIEEIADMYVGQTRKLHFNAPFGGELAFECDDGRNVHSLRVDITPGGTEPDIQENSFMKVTFDPMTVGTEDDDFVTVEVKNKCSLVTTLNSADGEVCEIETKMAYPQLKFIARKRAINELDYSPFEVYLADIYGNRLEQDQFPKEKFMSLYGDIIFDIKSKDSKYIGIHSYNADTGKGNIVPVGQLTGLDSYSACVWAKVSGTAKGEVTNYVNIVLHNIFGDIPVLVDYVENKILLTDDAKYSYVCQAFCSVADMPDAEIGVRHLGWDRNWDTGEDIKPTELQVLLHRSGDVCDLEIVPGEDASGPYAVRFTVTNPLTKQKFYAQTYLNIYLMLESCPYVQWNENGLLNSDIHFIWNVHPESRFSEPFNLFSASMKEKINSFFNHVKIPSADPASLSNRYSVGDVYRNWRLPEEMFFYVDLPDSYLAMQTTRCERYRFMFTNYTFILYDPFKKQVCSEGRFFTDEAVARQYLGGKPYLFGVTDNGFKRIRFSVHHTCNKYHGQFDLGFESDLHGQSKYFYDEN